MGLFSKVWKGIKKVGKKIAKRVKKTFKSIGKAIGKLGVVGQIGMMFLMPYAMGALSSFAGSALGTVGKWSANLLSKSGVGAKALGHTLNLINKAGTFAGKVYSSVSDTINGAIERTGNFLQGRGFVKTPVVDPNILQQGLNSGQSTLGDSAGKIIGKDGIEVSSKLIGADGKVIMDTGFDKAGFNTKALGKLPPESKNLLDLATDDFTKAITPVDAGKLAVEKGLTEPFFPRYFNRRAISARRDEFEDILTQHFIENPQVWKFDEKTNRFVKQVLDSDEASARRRAQQSIKEILEEVDDDLTSILLCSANIKILI